MFRIILLSILLAVFIFWQFVVLTKYISYKNTTIKIDIPNKKLILEDATIPFQNIESISVSEVEAPTTAERYFTRYAHNYYISSIDIKLKDYSTTSIQLISKAQVYKILKQLQPHLRIDDNIEYFKPQFADGPTIFALILIIFYIVYHVFLHK